MTTPVTDRLEALRLALGDRKVIELLKAGARARPEALTAIERRLLGVRS